jgi:protein gp37
VHFLSVEPLIQSLTATAEDELALVGVLANMQWVIVGGESGPQARPMNPIWVRDIRELCAEQGVPFLFKQWGEWVDTEHLGQHSRGLDRQEADGMMMYRVGKKPAGRVLDGRTWDEYPTTREAV